jgi:ubiquinone/menaquinone biosynthesis C-methylase UbiE
LVVREVNVKAGPAVFFQKDNGILLPVSDDFLLPFLTPTSPGTRYWEPPPPGGARDRQQGRVLLQLHQLLDLLHRSGIELAGKSLLDIGTGNGMIPRLMLEYSRLAKAVGVDPYLDGEHKTSWQPHDRDGLFAALADYIESQSPGELDVERYRHLTGFENFTLQPGRVRYERSGNRQFRFAKLGAHDLEQLGEAFDVLYCKAIDHISDWDGIFRAARAATRDGSVFVIKHFSFFAYLGPHRFATTNIPWGHLLLSDSEYRRFAQEFHAHRAGQMCDFYFTGLAFPRTTVHGLVDLARRNGFVLQLLVNEPMRHAQRVQRFLDLIPDFWQIVRENHPSVSVDEMLSGRYHFVFRRMA